MNKKLMFYRTVSAFALCIALGLACSYTVYSQTSNVSFPASFLETWKRDNFNNTLTFTAKTVKASSSTTTWNLVSINGNAYKMNNGKTDMTLTMRLDGGSLVVSGDSGQGENNWNGTWKLRPSTIVEGANLTAKLVWVLRNAQSNGDYTIELGGDETLSAQTLAFDGKTNITLRFTGGESERTITLKGNGSLFTVASGVNLVLGRGITLRGHDGRNNTALVIVNQGANLIMNEGSKITGNSCSSYYGGVYVRGGTFTMNGGEISDNKDFGDLHHGGGVTLYNKGTFTMNGGTISGNTNGGVWVSGGGTFTMNGGEITGNTYSGVNIGNPDDYTDVGTFIMNEGKISGNTSSYIGGGGVYMSKGTFTMSGGEISGNTASGTRYESGDGGGVYMRGVSPSTFTMSGGTISGNTAGNGGGVYVYGRFSPGGGTFTMNGGEISGNTASDGGGVYADGPFTMNKGEISGNTASRSGGGVYGWRINKTGGTIYGYVEGDNKSNVVKDKSGAVLADKGHAVFADDARRRESTAGPGDNLDPSKTGLAGGWGY